MDTAWNKLDKTETPPAQAFAVWAATPLWEELRAYMESAYQTGPVVQYSGCRPEGWNMKYRKGGRGLCTMYPLDGYFIALVVIGEREKQAFLQALPTLTEYTRALYERTKDKNGLCWLMFEVHDAAVLADVCQCIALRRAPQKPAPGPKD